MTSTTGHDSSVAAASDTAAVAGRGEWRKRRCLVTGASGFIGSALCRRLEALEADVWGLARRPAPPGFGGTWIVCDVDDREQVRSAMASCRPDVIFHLASIVSGARSLELVLPMLQSNLIAFVNVAIAAAEVKCSRIVAAGSLMEPDQTPMGVPSSPYAAAKLAANGYARMFAHVFGLPVVVARLFMTYGPGEQNFNRLVAHVAWRLLSGEKVPLSSGTHAFDWVYIDDVCEALLAIAASDGVIGRTIDVGTGVLTPVIDVARGVARRLDAMDGLLVGALPDRAGDPVRVADTATAAALTGWRARVDLERGLDLTVSWFKELAAAGMLHPTR